MLLTLMGNIGMFGNVNPVVLEELIMKSKISDGEFKSSIGVDGSFSTIENALKKSKITVVNFKSKIDAV